MAAGVPLIVGASLTLVTAIAKLAKEMGLATSSVTLITMSVVVPTSLLSGVPVRAPVLVLKVAQSGLLVILKVSVSPSTSAAAGVKL